MIEIQHVSKSYGRHPALADVNLRLEKGRCTALIGPNGSGKTTLIKSVLKMAFPEKGTIYFEGQDIKNDDGYRKAIGYMPQLSRFPENMKVSQLFNLVKSIRTDAADYDVEMYDQLEVRDFSSRPLGVLSEGMKQKVSAALAFYFRPEVLILDEPTAGLDPVANGVLKKKIMKCVGEKRLVLITSHILSDLDEITSHVVFLMEGKVWIDKDLNELRDQTNEATLNRIISTLLKNRNPDYAEDN